MSTAEQAPVHSESNLDNAEIQQQAQSPGEEMLGGFIDSKKAEITSIENALKAGSFPHDGQLDFDGDERITLEQELKLRNGLEELDRTVQNSESLLADFQAGDETAKDFVENLATVFNADPQEEDESHMGWSEILERKLDGEGAADDMPLEQEAQETDSVTAHKGPAGTGETEGSVHEPLAPPVAETSPPEPSVADGQPLAIDARSASAAGEPWAFDSNGAPLEVTIEDHNPADDPKTRLSRQQKAARELIEDAEVVDKPEPTLEHSPEIPAEKRKLWQRLREVPAQLLTQAQLQLTELSRERPGASNMARHAAKWVIPAAGVVAAYKNIEPLGETLSNLAESSGIDSAANVISGANAESALGVEESVSALGEEPFVPSDFVSQELDNAEFIPTGTPQHVEDQPFVPGGIDASPDTSAPLPQGVTEAEHQAFGHIADKHIKFTIPEGGNIWNELEKFYNAEGLPDSHPSQQKVAHIVSELQDMYPDRDLNSVLAGETFDIDLSESSVSSQEFTPESTASSADQQGSSSATETAGSDGGSDTPNGNAHETDATEGEVGSTDSSTSGEQGQAGTESGGPAPSHQAPSTGDGGTESGSEKRFNPLTMLESDQALKNQLQNTFGGTVTITIPEGGGNGQELLHNTLSDANLQITDRQFNDLFTQLQATYQNQGIEWSNLPEGAEYSISLEQ